MIMIRRRSTLACIFTAVLTLNVVVLDMVESRDMLSCYCMSTTPCSNGVQNCTNQDDYCMVAKVEGVIRAAGCAPPSGCVMSVYSCCETNMCNVIPDRDMTTISTATRRDVETRQQVNVIQTAKGSRPNETVEGDFTTISTVTDANAEQSELYTAQTGYETTSFGLTSIKCSSMTLVVSLIAITLNLYERM